MIYCAPFEKLELAFRNQIAQTNGMLFRRPQGTSENRSTKANQEIDSDLFMVRSLQSRNRKMTCFFRIPRLQDDVRGPKRAQNFVDVRPHFNQSFKSFKGEGGFCLKRDPHPTVRSTAQPTS